MPTTVDLAPSELVALPRASLAALRAALSRDLGGAFATYLQEAGYAGGDALFSAFQAWLASQGRGDAESLDLETFQARAAEFFRVTGWGSLAISSLHDVVAEVDSGDWAEADPSSGMPYPACHYTTGLFADFFGRTAAAPLAVLEVECRSSGSPRCRFLVGSAEVMGHLYDRMSAGTTYADAARELA
jgi:predicted hydrocarbon binding protein